MYVTYVRKSCALSVGEIDPWLSYPHHHHSNRNLERKDEEEKGFFQARLDFKKG
jgi:hypothetical protein